MTPRVHEVLLADMRLALLGELGARSIYPRLSRQARDPELAAVLGVLAEDEVEQTARLRDLMVALGGRPPERSRRRAIAAAALALVARVVGIRFALRICHDAEARRSRWYQAYAWHLAQVSEHAAARACEGLSQSKTRHSQLLWTWVVHGALRG